MTRSLEAIRDLELTFRSTRSKHEAHQRSRTVLEQMSRDPSVLSRVLEVYVRATGTFEKENYPVVAVPIAINPYFGLVANCWIPRPDRDTRVSTKAIHHHGDMLLSTVTAFGPGYEHWMFSTPALVDSGTDLYRMDLLEAAPHPAHHVAFVDSQIPHCPLYPASLSVTYALWSSRRPATWIDTVKRIPLLAKYAGKLRRVGLRLGLQRTLDLKVAEYFDFYPVDGGFKGMRERQEFGLGPNEDHLHSVFHVLQETGNEHLAPAIRAQLDAMAPASSRVVASLLGDLEHGRPIRGRLSAGHCDAPHANFTRDDIQRALKAPTATKDSNARQFADPPSNQEVAPARSR